MLDPEAVRSESVLEVARLGYRAPPPHLPVVFDRTDGYSLRPVHEVIERMAVLNVAVALSYGMPMSLASTWLSVSELNQCLAPSERALLEGTGGQDPNDIQIQVEALWALAWTIGIVKELDASQMCGNDLVHLMPDLKSGEPLSAWQQRLKPSLRNSDEVIRQLDLHYCITWALAEVNLRQLETPSNGASVRALATSPGARVRDQSEPAPPRLGRNRSLHLTRNPAIRDARYSPRRRRSVSVNRL